MDSDGVYKRVNINKVMDNVFKNNPNLTEAQVQDIAYTMIKELNKRVSEIVLEFENGEGYFMSCYYDSIDSKRL